MKKEKQVPYFNDLKIIAVNNILFQKGYLHHQTAVTPDIYSMEMILEGEVILNVDGREKHLKAPSLFWLGDDIGTFRFSHGSSSKPYRHFWVDFTGERGKKIYDTLVAVFPEGRISIPREDLLPILNIFEDLDSMFHQTDGYDASIAVLLIEKLLYYALKLNDIREIVSGDPYHLTLIYESFRHEPFQNYDLQSLASARGISSVYLRKLFKSHFGISIGEFVVRNRMQGAAELLKTGKYRISELSDLCGYSTPSTFTYFFHKLYGMSPREYKKMGSREVFSNRRFEQ